MGAEAGHRYACAAYGRLSQHAVERAVESTGTMADGGGGADSSPAHCMEQPHRICKAVRSMVAVGNAQGAAKVASSAHDDAVQEASFPSVNLNVQSWSTCAQRCAIWRFAGESQMPAAARRPATTSCPG